MHVRYCALSFNTSLSHSVSPPQTQTRSLCERGRGDTYRRQRDDPNVQTGCKAADGDHQVLSFPDKEKYAAFTQGAMG